MNASEQLANASARQVSMPARDRGSARTRGTRGLESREGRAMYKAAVRWLIRRNIGKLNRGDLHPTIAMFAADATLAFPGNNAFAEQFLPRVPRLDGLGSFGSPESGRLM